MIVPACALLAVLAPLLLGGRLGRFAVLRLHGTEVVSTAFVVQAAAVSLLPGPRRLLAVLHVGSYVAAAGFVVLNDVWHPWWRVSVDGRPARLLRANVLFRAVAVPKGRHLVRFTFRPVAGALAEARRRWLAPIPPPKTGGRER